MPHERPIRKEPFPREFPGALWYGEEEKEALARVIDSKSPFRFYGINPQREVEGLEREFAEFTGAKHAHAVGSGTGALFTAMTACGIGPGQEVLIPAHFWIATVAAVVRAGAIPVLVEIDDTYNMDPADLERKITPNSTAVIPVHMAGAPADIEAIVRIAHAHNLKVIEDCAQANGSTVGGKHIGTFGDIGIFSFQVNKNITAGEGGILVTNDSDLYPRLVAAHDIGIPWINGVPRADTGVVLWGCGTRMGELAASVLRVQLRRFPTILAAMRSAKQRILKGIAGVAGITPARPIDLAGDSSSFLIVRLDSREKAMGFTAALRETPLSALHLEDYHLHIYFNVQGLVEHLSNSPDGFPWTHPKNEPLVRDYRRGTCPQSDDLFERGVMISVPSRLEDKDIEDIIEIYRWAAEQVG
jgi:8-amino-3,8-dideoxy-alpha-D-manno-octulosonate transaminase